MRAVSLGARTLAALVVGAIAWASPAGAQADVSQVLLEDLGPPWGLERAGPVAPNSFSRIFADPAGDLLALQVRAVGEGVDPLTLVELLRGQAKAPFDVPELGAAFGESDGDPTATMAMNLTFSSDDFLFSAFLRTKAPVDARSLLVAVARRQLDRVGGRAPAAAPARDAAELDPFLVSNPPAEFGLGRATTVSLRQDRDLVADPRLLDLLSRRTLDRTRVWAPASDGLAAAVLVSKYPYSIMAATVLGAAEARSPVAIQLPGTEGLPGVTASVASNDPAAPINAFVRRGPYVAIISVLPGTDRRAAELLAGTLVADEAGLLPAGDASAYVPPTTLEGVLSSLGLVSVGAIAAAGVGRLRSRRWTGDVAEAPAFPSGSDVADVDGQARAMRRRGVVLFVLQLLALAVIVVGLAADLGTLGWVVAALGLAFGLGVTAWWRHLERSRAGAIPARHHVALPGLAGLAMGVVALGVLAVGVSYAFRGIRYLTFRPSLGQLGWSDRLGISPRAVGVVFAVGGLLVAAIGATLYRFARKLGRVQAAKLRRLDPRPPVLYLRSFEDDARSLPSIFSDRRPFLELLSIRGRDPFEEAVAWELSGYGPVVAVGRPGASLATLGAAREHLEDETWQREVANRMGGARAIVLAIGETPGLRWEISHVVRAGHLAKTILLWPPVEAAALAARWHFTVEGLVAAGASCEPLPVDPQVVHTAVIGNNGQVLVTAARRRDEATYRCAVQRAMADIGARTSAAPLPPPAPQVSARSPLPP